VFGVIFTFSYLILKKKTKVVIKDQARLFKKDLDHAGDLTLKKWDKLNEYVDMKY